MVEIIRGLDTNLIASGLYLERELANVHMDNILEETKAFAALAVAFPNDFSIGLLFNSVLSLEFQADYLAKVNLNYGFVAKDEKSIDDALAIAPDIRLSKCFQILYLEDIYAMILGSHPNICYGPEQLKTHRLRLAEKRNKLK